MKILIAPDSFKEALTAPKAAGAIASGLSRAMPQANLTLCPMGDGGEGSLEALLEATGSERRKTEVQDALGRPVQTNWGWNQTCSTAYIELAEASGLQHRARRPTAGHVLR